MNNADLNLARLCAIAYSDNAVQQYNRLNYRAAPLHHRWANDEAYILSNQTQLCVVARGTDDWQDWAQRNFFALPTTVPQIDIRAHWGLWEAAQSVLPAIEAAIVINRPEQIVFTGHSKGGAMALLWAIALQRYNPKVVTFGMPRVLTDDSVKVWHRRIVHVRDPVARVPPRAIGWKHHGLPIVVDDNGEILGTDAIEAEMAKPFDLKALPGLIGCHFQYGPELEALWRV